MCVHALYKEYTITAYVSDGERREEKEKERERERNRRRVEFIDINDYYYYYVLFYKIIEYLDDDVK